MRLADAENPTFACCLCYVIDNHMSPTKSCFAKIVFSDDVEITEDCVCGHKSRYPTATAHKGWQRKAISGLDPET